MSSPMNQIHSEKLVRTKTHLANYDHRNRFSDISDDSRESHKFLNSSLSIENDDDDYKIISAIQIQNSWRNFKQRTYMIKYSKALRVFDKMLKTLKRNNLCRIKHVFYKWRKAGLYDKMIKNTNFIKEKYIEILRQRKERSTVEYHQSKMNYARKVFKTAKLRGIYEKIYFYNSDIEEKQLELYKKLKCWKNLSTFMKRSEASLKIKKEIKRHMAKRRIKMVLNSAYLYYYQSTIKSFLLFADIYNCNDRVAYLSYVINKHYKKAFFNLMNLAKFNRTTSFLLNHLNYVNLTESQREVLKLWLRKMKLLRRKDHIMLKMFRIMRLSVKRTVFTELKLIYFIKKIELFQEKYKSQLKKNVFYGINEFSNEAKK
jgi:hypothetical protein